MSAASVFALTCDHKLRPCARREQPIGGTWREATYTDPVSGTAYPGHACEQSGTRSARVLPGTSTRITRGFRFTDGQFAEVAQCAVAWKAVNA